MTAKEDREDAVLDAFVAHLSQEGKSALLVEQPDRLTPAQRTYPDLTSDGLVRVRTHSKSADWSCDVMSLAAPVTHGQIPRFLHDDLDPVAEAHGLHLHVTGQINTVADLKALTSEVRRQAGGGAAGRLEVAGGTVEWQPAPVSQVTMAVGLPAPSSVLADQLVETLAAPLTSKATRQAAPAKVAGIGAVVLLDGLGPGGLLQGTHWIHESSDTVASAVRHVLSHCPGCQLDAVHYLHRDGTWHLAWGTAI